MGMASPLLIWTGMKGLPDELPADGTEGFTGLVCPDCSGNLVIARDAHYVSFRCRIGHAYSIAELITAKESALEAKMWTTVFSLEELAALLTGLEEHGLTAHLGSEACFERASLARRQADRLRAIVQDDRPLMPSDRRSGSPGPP